MAEQADAGTEYAYPAHRCGHRFSCQYLELNPELIYRFLFSLKSYDIENLGEFVDKINSIPDYLHFGVIDVLCNSERIHHCHDYNITGDVENDQYDIDVEDIMQEPYNIDVEDLNHEPYNPELEKFNIQLEKLANSNPE